MNERLIAILALLSAIVLTALIYLLIKRRNKKKQPRYLLKTSLLTRTEIEYYNAINAIVGKDYLVIPQVNLAAVIDKEGAGFRSELFRNADFGIFDYGFRPILLIEINDATHLRSDRVRRDESVALICKKARLPLVTFWTKDGVNYVEIREKLKKYL